MRSSSWVLAVACGFALIAVGMPRASAMTTAAPGAPIAGLMTAEMTEPVHCRNYRHSHRYGHKRSRGCRVIIIRR